MRLSFGRKPTSLTGKEKCSADCCAVTLHKSEIIDVQVSDFGGLLGDAHEENRKKQKKEKKRNKKRKGKFKKFKKTISKE